MADALPAEHSQAGPDRSLASASSIRRVWRRARFKLTRERILATKEIWTRPKAKF
jgi:hypothetical protein